MFELLNHLHEEIAIKKSDHAVIGETLDRLIEYTKTHFQLEERFLESMKYPEIAKHKAKHEALTQHVVQLQSDFAAGKTTVASELVKFMNDWLINHIIKTDKRYSAFLKGERIWSEKD